MLRAASLCLFVFVYAPLSISGANPPQQIAEAIAELPHLKASAPDRDWLVDSSGFKAGSYRTDDPREFALDNGLLRRIFRVSPNGATVAFDNLVSQQSMLRSIRPEARLTVNGHAYDCGGLVGQPNHAFLTSEWLANMTAQADALRLNHIEFGETKARFGWLQRRHHAPSVQWPPKGVSVRMDYSLDDQTGSPQPLTGIRVSVHYELYDGIPLMCKWITIRNESATDVTIDRLVCEELAAVEQVNWVEDREGIAIPHPDYLHVETDFAFGGFNHEHANRHVVHWRTDPLYATQVNYERKTPCLLVCEPTYGPAQRLKVGETFESFRVFELAYDGGDRERRSLALKRMYRTIAPWGTENPLTHHLLSNKPDDVRRAIDDAASVGFEAIILSFGSGFNMESQDPAYLQQWRDVSDYAESKGIELGSYSLFSSRNVGSQNMIVSPQGQKPTHGQCPAVTSEWGLRWLTKIRDFYERTGFDQFENDGPYPGDVDVTPRPPLQYGEQDSQWVQGRLIASLYQDLRAKGIYINAPDYYYLNGSNKCGMGYREVNWSLPRADQVIHTRQNIYDGGWSKTPSMGWMFVPLSEYHGGGAAATIEPLREHIDHYRRMLESNLGMGVQAHYRGPRLFDTEDTRRMVQDQVDWFKKYRDILESDFVHGRRADGRDLDWILHVNPGLEFKGMLCVYNPTEKPIDRHLRVSVKYTGLRQTACFRRRDEEEIRLPINDDGCVQLSVTVPANAMEWWLVR